MLVSSSTLKMEETCSSKTFSGLHGTVSQKTELFYAMLLLVQYKNGVN
jgi:hypothetical protein